MINLIDKIIEIDKDARGKVADAKNEASEILRDASAQVEALKNEYNDRIAKRLAIVNDTYSRFASDEINAILKKQAERIELLEDVMLKNKPRYEKEIISNILGTQA